MYCSLSKDGFKYQAHFNDNKYFAIYFYFILNISGERGGLVVNASDSISRGQGFEPHSGQTVLRP